MDKMLKESMKALELNSEEEISKFAIDEILRGLGYRQHRSSFINY